MYRSQGAMGEYFAAQSGVGQYEQAAAGMGEYFAAQGLGEFFAYTPPGGMQGLGGMLCDVREGGYPVAIFGGIGALVGVAIGYAAKKRSGMALGVAAALGFGAGLAVDYAVGRSGGCAA